MNENILRVGEIPFTNCCNVFYYLKRKYPVPGVEYRQGTPSELNTCLRRGQIDLCLSSSIEYAHGQGGYLVLPHYCLGSKHQLPSILLFSRLPLENLNGARIVLTAESSTTSVLCRIILGHFFGFSNEFITRNADLEDALEDAGAVVLIGDRALAARHRATDVQAWDLSSVWEEHTSLPFVFALWIIRTEAASEKKNILADFTRSLENAHRDIQNPDEDLVQWVLREKTFFTRASLIDYWGHIAYHLTEEHFQGLKLFYRLAYEAGQIPSIPEINFYQAK